MRTTSDRPAWCRRTVWALLALGGLASCRIHGPSDTEGSTGVAGSVADGAVVTSVDAATGAGTGGSMSGAGGQGGGGGGAIVAAAGTIVACGDTNRDGVVDAADLSSRSAFSWKRGAFMLANVDDDDGDGVSDAADEASAGDDLADLAELRIVVPEDVLAATQSLRLQFLAGGEHVRVFRREGDALVPVGPTLPLASSTELRVEAKRFAGPDWFGQTRLLVSALSKDATLLASDEVVLRVAPFILSPSSAVPDAVYVAKGGLPNSTFVSQLTAAVTKAKGSLTPPVAAASVAEMWLQSPVEFGYTQLPGHVRMHVALRKQGTTGPFAAGLPAQAAGVIDVGGPRTLDAADARIDEFGNLEVSPPVPGWPLGRVYYGRDVDTGIALHPEVVAFLEAQEVQAPFWVDTSWLASKHVDEVLTFALDSAKKVKLLIVSPSEAGKLHPSVYGPYSKSLQAKLDHALVGGHYVIGGVTVPYDGVLASLGLSQADVVAVPLYFTAGKPDWSNPINGIFLGGAVYAAGATGLVDADRKATANRFSGIGLGIQWLDDAPYHASGGNVHAATNATRLPVVPNFWTAVPSLP